MLHNGPFSHQQAARALFSHGFLRKGCSKMAWYRSSNKCIGLGCERSNIGKRVRQNGPFSHQQAVHVMGHYSTGVFKKGVSQKGSFSNQQQVLNMDVELDKSETLREKKHSFGPLDRGERHHTPLLPTKRLSFLTDDRQVGPNSLLDSATTALCLISLGELLNLPVSL